MLFSLRREGWLHHVRLCHFLTDQAQATVRMVDVNKLLILLTIIRYFLWATTWNNGSKYPVSRTYLTLASAFENNTSCGPDLDRGLSSILR